MELSFVVIILIILIIGLLIALYISYRYAPIFVLIRRSIFGRAAKREIEARFLNIDPDAIRAKLKGLSHGTTRSVTQEYKPTLLRRTVYALEGGYVRIRTEPRDGRMRVVMTSKIYPRDRDEAKTAERAAPVETEVVLSKDETYESAREFMASIGLVEKAQHEQFREEWRIDGEDGGLSCMIDIDWLPGLMPSLEIECGDDRSVRAIAAQLGLDYDSAVFGAYAKAYSRAYGMVDDDINKRISELKFATIAQVLEPYVKKNHDEFKRACEIRSPAKVLA